MPKYRRLSENNRKDIQTMFESGATKREIARSIDKSPSAVCRELARNRKRGGQYRSRRAHRVAKRRLVNKGTRPRLIRASLEKSVKTRLRKLHSPEQVANTLVVGSQGSPSTSTIYRFVRRDKDNGGKIHRCLRIRGRRPYVRRIHGRSTIPNRVSIDHRPQIVNTRRRYGDWEADLIEGAKKSGYFILTLCERKKGLLSVYFNPSSQNKLKHRCWKP